MKFSPRASFNARYAVVSLPGPAIVLPRKSLKLPGVFATMITNRNRSWIPKLESLIRGKDDALVIVGAGHLVGKDGVVELLRAKGYTIEQL